jgi:hypothetical protein
MDKEYAPISGLPEFCNSAINLALGDGNELVKNGLVGKINILKRNILKIELQF